jgi:hypothetical protein
MVSAKKIDMFLSMLVSGAILGLQAGVFVVFDAPTIKDKLVDGVGCNNIAFESSTKVCQDLEYDLKVFRDLTGVRVDLPVPWFAKTFQTVPVVTENDYSSYIESLNMVGPLIIAYKELYGDKLDKISFAQNVMGDPKVGGFYNNFNNQIIVNSTDINEHPTTILHEYAHSTTKFEDREQPIRVLQYFFGPQLESMMIISNSDDYEIAFPSIREYSLQNSGATNGLEMKFSNIINMPPSQRIPFLKSMEYNLSEVESVMIETLYDNRESLDPNTQEFILRKIVLLSNGNPKFLTEEFLMLMAKPLGIGNDSYTLTERKELLDQYFAKPQEYVISPRLQKYYDEAREYDLFLNLNKERLLNRIYNNWSILFYLVTSLALVILIKHINKIGKA